MREIKFRGRSVDSDEWVYGNLVECDYREYHCFIVVSADWEEEIFVDAWDNKVKQVDLISQEIYGVNPETVGQYTGMNDCNNVEIYDGDICVDSKDNIIRIMQTNSYQWGCKVIKADNVSIRGLTFPLWQWDDDRKFKKVGNIHENPELMESEE